MKEMIRLAEYLSCHFKSYNMKKNNSFLSIFIMITILSSCSKDGGSFNGTYLQPGFATQTSSGQVNFWAQDPWGLGDQYIHVPAGILTISIGGQTNTLFYYLNSAGPASCGALGVLNFSLPTGTHSWNAWYLNRTDTIRGSVSISSGAPCVFIRIN